MDVEMLTVQAIYGKDRPQVAQGEKYHPTKPDEL